MFSPFYTPVEEKRRLTNNKGIAMAQWKIANRNGSFVNLPRLPFTCKISRALHLAEPVLLGRQTNYMLFSKFLKFTIDQNIENFVAVNGDTALLQSCQCIQGGFFGQSLFQGGLWGCKKSGSHSFPGRSLLLSTNVLNDSIDQISVH